MNNQSKQIIPTSQTVARCIDEEIVEMLDSHSTFTIMELIEIIKLSGVDRASYRDELMSMIAKGNLNHTPFQTELVSFIHGDKIKESKYTSYEILRKALLDGTECTLLQDDGKGWQKGKLKICLEFIPEDNEDLVIAQENSVKIAQSPLDGIRQLANSLPIDQN
jgi:KGK domain